MVSLQHWTPGEGAGRGAVDRASRGGSRAGAMLAKDKESVKPGEVELVEFESKLLTRF